MFVVCGVVGCDDDFVGCVVEQFYVQLCFELLYQLCDGGVVYVQCVGCFCEVVGFYYVGECLYCVELIYWVGVLCWLQDCLGCLNSVGQGCWFICCVMVFKVFLLLMYGYVV